jgi:FAD/FMN-containing dehydrogenase
VRWGSLQAALEGTGLTGLVGSNPDVTVVGYCLGGGLSWFSRAFGRGAGALRAAEVVDAVGRHRWVTDAMDPDLMWALRGGGGDLAIVTAVEIDLFPAPQIYGGLLAFPGDAARPVLGAFAEATRTAPDELTLWAMLMHLPDVEMLPPEVRGQSFTVVGAAFLGTPDDAERHLAPIRAAAPVVRDTVRPVGPGEVGLLAEEPVEPTPAVLAATYAHTFDDAAIERVLGVAGVGTGTPLVQVQVRHLGGALARDGRPAVAGARPDPYLVSAMSMVMAPEHVEPVFGALDGFMAALEPWSRGAAPLTFLDRGEPLTRAYAGADLDRLRTLKATVDPDGVIRGNVPIPSI